MNRKKVLLADDVELFLELEKTFFQRKEIDLVVARTGQQAVDLARSELPDLIFMDLFMPEMDGSEACRLIKQDAQLKSIPVIMVTQGGREEDISLCRDVGCDEILFKPINRHLFMQAARRFLDFDNREFPRVDTRLTIHYGINLVTFSTDMAINLGERGLFIVTPHHKPPGSVVFLDFSLPDCEISIQCQGEVTWLNTPGRLARPSMPAGMGLSFVDLEPEALLMIREFIKQECLAPSW